MKVRMIPVVTGTLGTIHKSLVKRDGRDENWRTGQDYPNYNKIKIGKNTEKSPRNLLSFRLHMKEHLLVLVEKTHKE